MKYLAAIVLPPLALLMIGKPGHFVLNASLWILSIPLTLMFWIFALLWLACIVHAVAMCIEHDAEYHERHPEPDEMTILPRH